MFQKTQSMEPNSHTHMIYVHTYYIPHTAQTDHADFFSCCKCHRLPQKLNMIFGNTKFFAPGSTIVLLERCLPRMRLSKNSVGTGTYFKLA